MASKRTKQVGMIPRHAISAIVLLHVVLGYAVFRMIDTMPREGLDASIAVAVGLAAILTRTADMLARKWRAARTAMPNARTAMMSACLATVVFGVCWLEFVPSSSAALAASMRSDVPTVAANSRYQHIALLPPPPKPGVR